METKCIVMTSTFYPPYHLGGDAVHVRYLAEELADRGHEVHVLHSMDAYKLKSRNYRSNSFDCDVNVHTINSNLGSASAMLTYATGSNRGAERELRRIVSEVNPDWIHHHNISLLGHGMLDIGNMPHLYTAHDHWLVCPRSDMMYCGREHCDRQRCVTCSICSWRPPQLWRDESFYNKVDDIDYTIAPSKYISDILYKRMGLQSIVMPNFVPRPDAESNDPMHFLFAGVLEPHKGLDKLLHAYEISGVQAELHIAGSGSLESMVANFEERTNGKVRGLGFLQRDDMIRELSSALCLVAPSASPENSPLSCIEALSMGVPLLVSSVGGLPELISGPCGLAVDLEVNKLASALRMFEDDRHVRDQMASNAIHRYEEMYTPEAYVDRYLMLMESAA